MNTRKTISLEIARSSGPAVAGQPRAWLRAEGVLALAVAVALYASLGGSWILFAVLFLAPDTSFGGYLAGPRAGAAIYNAAHSHAGPLAATLILLLLDQPVTLPLIWFAHIGFDRALGYGLKYPSAFQDTHLGRIGKPAGTPLRKPAIPRAEAEPSVLRSGSRAG
jgi:hypothetical protein